MSFCSVSATEFKERFRVECVGGSAIAPHIYDQAIEIVEDTGFWEPNRALNHEVSVNYQTRKPHSFGAIAAFINHDGSIWQAKPENPRIDWQKTKQKSETVSIRYEIPVGAGSRLYCPPVVSLERYFKDLEPITIAEGGKKTLALHSVEFLAVGLAGCNGGYRLQDNGSYSLTPDVEAIAHPGREITIAFDQDEKFETVERVNRAIATFGKLLVDRGCKVFVAIWDGRDGCKGVDDLIVNRGVEAWDTAYSNRVPFKKFAQAQQQRGKVAERDRTIKQRTKFFDQKFWQALQHDFTITPSDKRIRTYEGYTPIFDSTEAKTAVIQGWLGAGKTEAILNSLQASPLFEGALWLGHRNGTLEDTQRRAREKGIGWVHFQDDVPLGRLYLRDGLDGLIVAFAYGSLSDYHFKWVDWSDRTVVIDEFSALRKELASYPKLLKQFEKIIRECKHLIVADAFLSDYDLDFIQSIRDGNSVIYQQKFRPNPTPVKLIQTRTKDGAISYVHDGALLPIIRQWVEQGLSFAVGGDSAIEVRVLAQEAERLGIKTKLCWSKSIESNREFLPRINNALEQEEIQSFFYTPTIQNGADIQVVFDRVLILARGVLSPLQILQISGRVRHAGEIWVSASRKTVDPASVTVNLDSSRIEQLTEKVTQAFSQEGFDTPANLQDWGLRERLTNEIEHSFNAEYIEKLLQRYFASVEVVEVASSAVKEWRSRLGELRLQDSERILLGDLLKGQELLKAEKQPSSEFESWSIELAKIHEKYPSPTRRLREAFQNVEGDRTDILKTFNILREKRLDKLKYWQIAEQGHPDDCDRLLELARSQPITYTAPIVKVRQYTELYRVLRLKRIVCADQTQKLISDRNALYNCPSDPKLHSRALARLWREFQNNQSLQRLFPLVETLNDFWVEIGKCFRFLGFEGRSQQQRIKTEKEYPNGSYRNGQARFSRSRTVYLKGWVRMSQSGNRFFKEIFPELVEAINEDLEFAREHWRKRREEGVDPPWENSA